VKKALWFVCLGIIAGQGTGCIARPSTQEEKDPIQSQAVIKPESILRDKKFQGESREINSVSKKVTAVQMILDSQLKLRIRFGEVWSDFSVLLPEGNLTQKNFSMNSVSDVQASILCESVNCSHANVSLEHKGKRATLSVRQMKLVPGNVELQRNCSTPLFFSYELDDLLDGSPRVQEYIDRLDGVSELSTTISHVSSWDAGVTETASFALFEKGVQKYEIFATDGNQVEPPVASSNEFLQPISISYEFEGEDEKNWPSSIKFSFALNPKPTVTSNAMATEICYRLDLIPDAIASKPNFAVEERFR
jgi:hypothetical protein